MRIFLNKWFDKFCRKNNISEKTILDVAQEVSDGLIDADYGHGVIKKRIARDNQGKSSGFRSIILYKKENNMFFVYGFPKKDRDNIDKKEEDAFKALADEVLNMTCSSIEKAIENNIFKEVKRNDKNV